MISRRGCDDSFLFNDVTSSRQRQQFIESTTYFEGSSQLLIFWNNNVLIKWYVFLKIKFTGIPHCWKDKIFIQVFSEVYTIQNVLKL